MRASRILAAGLMTLALTACGTPADSDPAPARSYSQGPASSAPAAPSAPASAPTHRPPASTDGAAASTTQAAAPTAAGPGQSAAATSDVPVSAAAAVEATSPAPRATVTVTAAPTPTKDDGTRVLAIPAQGVRAAVYECPTQDGVVEPPPMVKDVCWWTGSRPLAAAEGVSIVVGHSTRSESSTGALERTRDLPIGSVVSLAGQSWKVVQIEPDVDKLGLPAWVTYATGPRMLGLITCDLTNRKSNVLIQLVPA